MISFLKTTQGRLDRIKTAYMVNISLSLFSFLHEPVKKTSCQPLALWADSHLGTPGVIFSINFKFREKKGPAFHFLHLSLPFPFQALQPWSLGLSPTSSTSLLAPHGASVSSSVKWAAHELNLSSSKRSRRQLFLQLSCSLSRPQSIRKHPSAYT